MKYLVDYPHRLFYQAAIKKEPQLKFKGIVVRKIKAGDINSIYRLIKSDGERNLYLGNSFNFSREEFIKFIFYTEYGTKSLPMGIERKGVLIGLAVINNISSFKNSAHFRFLIISEKERERGYGCWAGAIIVWYLFEELKINKVYAGTWSHNPNMDSIYKWAGFKLEGIDREHARVNGEFADRKLWGLLNRETPKRLKKIFTRIKNENKNRKDIWSRA